MTISLAALFAPMERDEVLASLLEVAQDVGLPATAWQKGSVGRTILVVVAQKYADLTQVLSLSIKGGLLDYATGGWLRLLARSVYGVEFLAATFAIGTVTLTNASTVAYTGGTAIKAGDLRFANSVTGKTYSNTSGGDLAASGGTLDVTIAADGVGADSNANPGEVTELVTVLTSVTCTNAVSVLGLNDEKDEDLRQRCRDKLAALSPNGAAGAYAYFAKSAVRSDGTVIGVTRVRTIGNSTFAQATVYVATAAGVVTGTADNPATDLGAINFKLQTTVVPTGISMTLLSAAVHNVDVQATIYVAKENTLTSAEMKTAILTRLADYFASIPIGGFDIGAGGRVFLTAIIGQIFQASPYIVDVVITSPGADVVMLENEVAISTTVGGDLTVVQL